VLVTPQEICSLWPRIIPGTPAKMTPPTFMSSASKCISYQIDGVANPRCGSSAKSGFPDAVFSPLTTQLLLPLKAGGTTAFSKLVVPNAHLGQMPYIFQ